MPVSVFPTGVIRCRPEKCWPGFTLFQASLFEGRHTGAVLIDMNGRLVKQWQGLEGFPNKMLPGGYVMGSRNLRDPRYSFQDMVDLVQVDWEGRTVWQFERGELIQDPGQEPLWMVRQHHDYQREGNPVGYYAPGQEPLTDRGRTLILTHRDLRDARISPQPLLEDVIIEVDWEGRREWEWSPAAHLDELGFSETARRVMYRNPDLVMGKVGDWMHLNSISRLGPNCWYDRGDARFHPDNIIWSSRQASILGIIDRQSGRLVWKTGPDYSTPAPESKLGWIIGPHHAHMIPRGLPGEGHILVFDNGGLSGYGSSHPGSPDGLNYAQRDYSRVIEFDPVSLEIVWQYPHFENPAAAGMAYMQLYSKYISSAQRLANGNTLITEGGWGRFLEVTPQYEVVWEYVSPYFSPVMKMNPVYRAYRVPAAWVPQAELPPARAVQPVENSRLNLADWAGGSNPAPD